MVGAKASSSFSSMTSLLVWGFRTWFSHRLRTSGSRWANEATTTSGGGHRWPGHPPQAGNSQVRGKSGRFSNAMGLAPELLLDRRGDGLHRERVSAALLAAKSSRVSRGQHHARLIILPTHLLLDLFRGFSPSFPPLLSRLRSFFASNPPSPSSPEGGILLPLDPRCNSVV